MQHTRHRSFGHKHQTCCLDLTSICTYSYCSTTVQLYLSMAQPVMWENFYNSNSYLEHSMTTTHTSVFCVLKMLTLIMLMHVPICHNINIKRALRDQILTFDFGPFFCWKFDIWHWEVFEMLTFKTEIWTWIGNFEILTFDIWATEILTFDSRPPLSVPYQTECWY